MCCAVQAFSSMWGSISTAKSRVWVETFILEPDPVGLRMIAELTDAARRGCQYVLLLPPRSFKAILGVFS